MFETLVRSVEGHGVALRSAIWCAASALCVAAGAVAQVTVTNFPPPDGSLPGGWTLNAALSVTNTNPVPAYPPHNDGQWYYPNWPYQGPGNCRSTLVNLVVEPQSITGGGVIAERSMIGSHHVSYEDNDHATYVFTFDVNSEYCGAESSGSGSLGGTLSAEVANDQATNLFPPGDASAVVGAGLEVVVTAGGGSGTAEDTGEASRRAASSTVLPQVNIFGVPLTIQASTGWLEGIKQTPVGDSCFAGSGPSISASVSFKTEAKIDLMADANALGNETIEAGAGASCWSSATVILSSRNANCTGDDDDVEVVIDGGGPVD